MPFWAVARVFGRDPMYLYRLEVGLGRNSVVGTTVRQADMPEHLLVDEHHHTRRREGQRRDNGRWRMLPGAALAQTAGNEDLRAAYAVFERESKDV